MRGLYAIIDPEQCAQDPEQVASAVLRGGCAIMQLRDKRASDKELIPLATRLATLCRAQGVPFILNDRFWLVRETGAQGTHLGQTDESIELARKVLTEHHSIGLSTHNLAQAQEAEKRGANLIGFGPIFKTKTKQNPDPEVGLHQLQQVVRQIKIPIVAIGGINLSNAESVAQTKVPLAAAIAALCKAPAPEAAARALHSALLGG